MFVRQSVRRPLMLLTEMLEMQEILGTEMILEGMEIIKSREPAVPW